MRLIDADALLESFKCTWAFLSDDDYIEAVINAPTVKSEASSRQEPVAYLNDDNCIDDPIEAEHVKKMQARGELLQYTIPLYTSPPKREWVGLTCSDIASVLDARTTLNEWQLCRDIEAKLKELNHD